MEVRTILVKAFTKNKEKGNPAGVVLDATELSDEHMQYIAAELGFSETAFVLPSEKASFRIRFFTPKEEVKLCGHATIATFHALAESGKLSPGKYTQETLAGILPVTCHEDGQIVMKQTTPEFLEEIQDVKRIASLLGIQHKALLKLPLEVISTGAAKLILPVDSLQTLQSIRPDLDGIAEFCKETTARGFYPFTQEVIDEQADFHARQFNPLLGIPEDPVTGVAAGALGCYAKKHQLSNKTTFVVEQGHILGKDGQVFVDVSDDVLVGGYAVTYGEKTVTL